MIRNRSVSIGRVSMQAGLVLFCLVILFPIFSMVSGSFKTAVELSANPAGLPMRPNLLNYRAILVANSFVIRAIGNSAFITSSYIAVNLLISSLAAYSFAKFTFPGKNVLFVFLLATMMIPKEVLLPPLYIIFSRIGWLNSYRVQIFADAANVFGVFMLRQYFENIPDAVLESARIDGAGHARIFRQLVLPMSAPALGAFAILQFNHKWNDYLWPVMFMRDIEKMPIMAVLPRIQTMEGNEQLVPWELILAGCTLVTIPVIIVFLIFQDKIMTSMTAGAVKE